MAVTKKSNGEGRANRLAAQHKGARATNDCASALQLAFYRALKDFTEKNGYPPDLDDVIFKGGVTTNEVVIEIEEVVFLHYEDSL